MLPILFSKAAKLRKYPYIPTLRGERLANLEE